LDQQNILGRNIIVAGTNALFAYEAVAGVFLEPAIIATMDIDILWDTPPRLTLVSNDETDQPGLLEIIRKADRSFEPMGPGSFRAVNKNGYMVDLIKPEPKHIARKDRRTMGDENDLQAAEIRNLQWLLSAPKFSQIVMGDDGYPAAMVVPDPRAFALHKLWLSEQQDREPIKKRRDRDQAIAVAALVAQYLPQKPFDESELRMFPKELLDAFKKKVSGSDAPVGF